MWSGDLHYSDPQFISISCSCPVCFFKDTCHGKSWEYRQLGEKSNPEAVIFIPGIRETVSSYFHMMPAIASRGYRVLTVSYLNCETFTEICDGFNELMKNLSIRAVHFCGDDFGGFIALQIASYAKKLFLTKSITLINSYTTLRQFRTSGIGSFKLLGFITAKSELLREMETYNVYQKLSESLYFITHEIEQISTTIAQCRVALRNSKPFPIDIQIPEEAVSVVETQDRLIQYSPDSDPLKTFPKAVSSLMKTGGDWPHLEAPADLLSYLLVHLKKWGESKIEESSE